MRDVVGLLHVLLHVLDGHAAGVLGPALLGYGAHVVLGELPALLAAHGGRDEALLAEALDGADVGAGALGHETLQVLGDLWQGLAHVLTGAVLAHAVAEGADEAQLELVAGHLDADGEAATNAAGHALVKAVLAHAQLGGGAVGRDDDLLAV